MTQQIHPKDKYENLILALLEQQAGAEYLFSYPIAATIDPSSACILKCKFCLQSKEPAPRSRDIMKWDLFKHIVDEIGPYLFHVDLFNWGEPFLNKRLPELIAELKKHGVTVSISTNFSLPISDEVLESLIYNQLDHLIVSLDGNSQQTYEKYRVGGKFDLVMSNMRRLAEKKKSRGATKPNITWQFLVFSFNEHEISEAKSLADHLGIRFNARAPYVNVENYPDWLSTIDKYVMDKYKSYKNKAKKSDATKCQSNPLIEYMNKMSARICARHSCDFLYLSPTINANGSLSPCCGTVSEKQDFGRVTLKNTFHDAWNNDKSQIARRLVYSMDSKGIENPEEMICVHCPLPEATNRWQSTVRGAMNNAPKEVWDRVAKFLPYTLVYRDQRFDLKKWLSRKLLESQFMPNCVKPSIFLDEWLTLKVSNKK